MDSHIYDGYSIPTQYDSMIGKIIVWAGNRDLAIRRMRGALDETVVSGIHTTTPFQIRVLDHPTFRNGEVTTRFLEEMRPEPTPEPEGAPVAGSGQ